MYFIGKNYSRAELTALIVVIIVSLVIYVALIVYMQRWHNEISLPGNDFKISDWSLPPWLMVIFTGILVGIIAYGGYWILSREASSARTTCFTIWGGSVITLWAAYAAFFQRQLTVESAYLQMLFIAFHAALSFKILEKDSLTGAVYILGVFIAVHSLLVTIDTIKINRS